MSERASWMPKKIEMEHASREYSATAGWFLFDRLPLEGLLRAAVEKALAEQMEDLEIKLCPEDVGIEEYVRHLERKLAEQEARHKREVIEARITELGDIVRYSACGEAARIAATRYSDACAELAALDREGS